MCRCACHAISAGCGRCLNGKSRSDNSLWRLDSMQKHGVSLSQPRCQRCSVKPYGHSEQRQDIRLTGPKTTAVHKHRKPGTSIGRLVLLLETIPTTTWAENIHESEIPIKTIVHRETLVNVDGVRVISIWRTRSSKRVSWVSVAKAASVGFGLVSVSDR